MKKKILISLGLIFILLAVLFVPIPTGSYNDGGTRQYTALTYKIVDWNKIHSDGIYKKTRIYFGNDRNKSIEQLWESEYEFVQQKFIAQVLEITENYAIVEPIEGENELLSSNKFSIGIKKLGDIGAKVGSTVEITYTGGIMESYPAQIKTVSWRLLDT